jgi:Predicted membrane protein (DUF2231)
VNVPGSFHAQRQEETAMFDLFNGLPLHALVVHAAVVLTPLAAVIGIAFAIVRSWRWLLRWPLVVVALLALGTVFVAVQSGNAFRARLRLPSAIIQAHAAAGQLLLYVMAGYAVLAVVAALTLGGPSALRSGKGARAGASGALQAVLVAVLIVGSVGLGYQVFKTGEAGSRAVWGSVASN